MAKNAIQICFFQNEIGRVDSLLLASALHRKSYKNFPAYLEVSSHEKKEVIFMVDRKRAGGLFFCVKHLCITEKKIKARDLTFIACHM